MFLLTSTWIWIKTSSTGISPQVWIPFQWAGTNGHWKLADNVKFVPGVTQKKTDHVPHGGV